MRNLSLLMIALSLLISCVDAHSHWALQQTTNVPIDRLFANLERRFEQKTNDFELTYELARLHSMSYATNLAQVKVITNTGFAMFYYPSTDSGVPHDVEPRKSADARAAAVKHLTNAISLYDRALVLLEKSTNVNEQRWMILPVELGRAWCLDQAGRREDAIKAYRRTLGIAWKIEVTGDFKFTDWAKDVVNDVKSGRNPLRVHNRGDIGPGVCFSEEVIGYLLKLLDPVKDAKEIADLKQRQKTLLTMGRAITPIFVSLEPEASLAELVNPSAQVAFDLDGSGLQREWGWITPKAAWLVYDPSGSGKITSALQMFGNVTFWIFWRDGYQALTALDDNSDGMLRENELSHLALWQDSNCNGVSDPGEVRPLRSFGIVAVACSSQTVSDAIKWNAEGMIREDGRRLATYDWIAPSPAVSQAR